MPYICRSLTLYLHTCNKGSSMQRTEKTILSLCRVSSGDVHCVIGEVHTSGFLKASKTVSELLKESMKIYTLGARTEPLQLRYPVPFQHLEHSS